MNSNAYQQLSQHDRTRNRLVAASAAVSGVLGYGIARALARATEYAEDVEEQQYCRTPEDCRAPEAPLAR
jgi:hypothetical protein